LSLLSLLSFSSLQKRRGKQSTVQKRKRGADAAAGARRQGGMDEHGGGAGKLTRTPSSLLRSPTMCAGPGTASFHALDDPEPDDKKAQAPLGKPRALLRCAHHRFRPGPAQSALLLLPVLTLAALLMHGGDGGHHLALLAAAAGFALAAAAAVARLRGARPRSPALEASVRWFIGEDDDEEQRDWKRRAGLGLGLGLGRRAEVREGVEFYSHLSRLPLGM
jgi:hypothetical protein